MNVLTDLEKYEKLEIEIREIIKDLDVKSSTLYYVVDEFGNFKEKPRFLFAVKGDPRKLKYSLYEKLNNFAKSHHLEKIEVYSTDYYMKGFYTINSNISSKDFTEHINPTNGASCMINLKTEFKDGEATRIITDIKEQKSRSYKQINNLKSELNALGFEEKLENKHERCIIDEALGTSDFLLNYMLDLGFKKMTTMCSLDNDGFIIRPYFIVDLDYDLEKLSYNNYKGIKRYSELEPSITLRGNDKIISFGDVKSRGNYGVLIRIEKTLKDEKLYIDDIIGPGHEETVQKLKDRGFVETDDYRKRTLVEEIEELEDLAREIADEVKTLKVVKTHVRAKINELGEIKESPEFKIFVDNEDPGNIEYNEYERLQEYDKSRGVRCLSIESYVGTPRDRLKHYPIKLDLLSNPYDYKTTYRSLSYILSESVITKDEKQRYIRKIIKTEKTNNEAINNTINHLKEINFTYDGGEYKISDFRSLRRMLSWSLQLFEVIEESGIQKVIAKTVLDDSGTSVFYKPKYTIYIKKDIKDIPYDEYELFKYCESLVIANDEKSDFGYKEIDESLKGVHLAFEITSDSIKHLYTKVVGEGFEDIAENLKELDYSIYK